MHQSILKVTQVVSERTARPQEAGRAVGGVLAVADEVALTRRRIVVFLDEIDVFAAAHLAEVEPEGPLAAPVVQVPRTINDILVALGQTHRQLELQQEVLIKVIPVDASAARQVPVLHLQTQVRLERLDRQLQILVKGLFDVNEEGCTAALLRIQLVAQVVPAVLIVNSGGIVVPFLCPGPAQLDGSAVCGADERVLLLDEALFAVKVLDVGPSVLCQFGVLRHNIGVLGLSEVDQI